jgi:hypothetical protein
MIAYLILAHNTPNQLRRLVTALSSGSSSFFIHLDRKSNFDDFSMIIGDNISFTQERVPVYRSDFSHIEAILILIQMALSDIHHFDRFVLLSATDYPLRSTSYIERFFESKPDKEFIDLVAMPNEAHGKPISRLTLYHFRPTDRWMAVFIRKVFKKVGILPRELDYRHFLGDLAPYGGSEWWALSREACEFILTFMKKEIQVVNFFKHTKCPGESLFQTILGNSFFRPRIVRSLTYADWSNSVRGHPAYITEKHLPFFQSTAFFPTDAVLGDGEMLFARKFSDESEDLVAKLEKQRNEPVG